MAERLKAAARRFVADVNARGGLQPVTTAIVLREGEEAYFDEQAVLLETRSVRQSRGMGLAFRIARGIYLGGGDRYSESAPLLRRIDKGRLVMTNKRLIFDGATENRTIVLKDIISFTPYLTAVEVSVASRAKSMIFKLKNPVICATVGQILCRYDNPQAVDSIQLTVKIR
ncbi:MAG: hypothetical protein N2595_02690 [bacterium]|nr:hypothetical protein [bacterium]